MGLRQAQPERNPGVVHYPAPLILSLSKPLILSLSKDARVTFPIRETAH